MRAVGFGVAAALVIAGPKLYGLVQDGVMSDSTALLRGAVVAVACAAGFAVVAMIGSGYRQAHEQAAAEAAAAEAAEAAQAEAEAKARAEAQAEREDSRDRSA